MKRVFSALAAFGMLLVSCDSEESGSVAPAQNDLMVITFQQGAYPASSYDRTADVPVAAKSPTANLDTLFFMPAGKGPSDTGRVLIEFDISEIVPPDVKVESAYLTFYGYSAMGVVAIAAYAVNAAWSEAEATWNERMAATAWATAGGDVNPTPVSDYVAVPTEASYVTLSLDTRMVVSWITDPAANHGVMIRSSNETGDDGTAVLMPRHAGNAYQRPKLTIYYRLP